ncbi:G-type lectin S-receptor-like serine/threonine-protein kinase [Quillaja saponaria]|uniref:Receptor-like serine/threonine-protein kinase n=1 Tax=Quillaja saponaria TaxID=32244 RepID=A0AAD7KW37_QUISA|nr:G-type lectin S-receptor-like serine/threonine-protein kinase [Quillaja saponaria]
MKSDTLTPKESIIDGQELISSGESFILGFFSPGSSNNRYVGIWYKGIMPKTIVWVANRESPLNDTRGQIIIGADGKLVLLDGAENVIWSTSSSRLIHEPVAKLLDSGNLVVMNGNYGNPDSYVWQSFDYPSDTLIAGLKIGWDKRTGLHRYLTSWKSANDPSLGNFTYGFDFVGVPQLVIREESNIKFRTGLWNGIVFNSYPFKIFRAFMPVLNITGDEVSYMDGPGDRVTRLVVKENGLVERFLWANETLEWIKLYEIRKDTCDSYEFCGPNGICRLTDVPVYCDCLTGFIPKLQDEWDAFNWSSGCRRRTQLNCTESDGFLKLSKVKLPNLLQFWINNNFSLGDCKLECLKNCSCTAYANSGVDGGPHGCLLWYGDLIDIRLLTSGASDNVQLDLYLRLAASEIDSITDARRKKKEALVLIISLTLAGMLVLVSVMYLVRKRNKERKKNARVGSRIHREEPELPLFDIVEILEATNKFSADNKIGEGGFGPVYKGKLVDGQEVAVKRLSRTSKQGISEFMNEVRLVTNLQHRNLVRVLGGCIEGNERILVYEYMSNKSLDNFIFDPRRSSTLNWKKRHDIVMGIARGLLYLHQDSRLTIIHRDLKTSNVLLDSRFNAKISDFGMAHTFRGDQSEAKTKRIAGTYGYMPPEYAINGRFSAKSDVFSFGVIVLEILSGIKNKNFDHPDHHQNLLGQAWILWKERRPLEFMDSNSDHSYVPSELLRCMHVGLLCVQKFPDDRPTMLSVVFMLGNDSMILLEPKEPGFFGENSRNQCSQEECYSNNAMSITLLEARK